MHPSNCLNCGTPVDRKFCPECGQKTDTHRITPQHFVMHDLLHGVMHVDKGILFTLKETFTRPGYAARDYMAGKRKNYYNVFYLIFLILGFYLIINGHDALATQIDKKLDGSGLPEQFVPIAKFFVLYTKYLVLLVIPTLALSGFIVFQRLNYNYAEHVIISGFTALGGFIILMIGVLTGKLYGPLNVIISLFGPPLFMILVYYQATKHKYSFLAYTLSLIPFFLLSLLWVFILVGIIAGIFIFN